MREGWEDVSPGHLGGEYYWLRGTWHLVALSTEGWISSLHDEAVTYPTAEQAMEAVEAAVKESK